MTDIAELRADRSAVSSDWGAVFYAIGATYVREAEEAARSVRAHMPDLPLCLFSDVPPQAEVFDHALPPGDELTMKQQKMHALLNSPFAKTIYIDTDVFLAAPIYECFDIIDDGHGYDMAAALTPRWSPDVPHDGRQAAGRGPRIDGVPVAFPKINAGMMLFARTPAVTAMLERWRDLHAADGGRGQDQESLRVALYESDVRLAVLPPHYNYRTIYPGVVFGQIKLLHGRHRDMAKLAKRFNAWRGVRGTIPTRGPTRIIIHGLWTTGAGWIDRLVRLALRAIT
ncbi:MAG: hypothetical protein WA979_14590 [Pacificimonas sp.]